MTFIISILFSINNFVAVLPKEVEMPEVEVSYNSNKFHK